METKKICDTLLLQWHRHQTQQLPDTNLYVSWNLFSAWPIQTIYTVRGCMGVCMICHGRASKGAIFPRCQIHCVSQISSILETSRIRSLFSLSSRTNHDRLLLAKQRV
eukprot:Blabericola_migrator_1__3072@NODE_1898_length_3592_cov_148_977872_g1215_i0_p3_GENE_NODE_1898_length_3592_cov_148_977872_g1215_i0NODE_1898_length_3592_cov_148_977872_g1215_i0_p3_ORF_typecomplete_len108_score0_95Peptidase_C74/PF12387_8/0_03_NODE_1898_length_3592_cov_148_977872_g1215_i0617940